MKRRKKSKGFRGLAGTSATHERGANMHMNAARKALGERRPCAALAEAHKAEVEVRYISDFNKRSAAMDDLAQILGEAGTMCPCKHENLPHRGRGSRPSWLR